VFPLCFGLVSSMASTGILERLHLYVIPNLLHPYSIDIALLVLVLEQFSIWHRTLSWRI
jgi:hypothetical protein